MKKVSIIFAIILVASAAFAGKGLIITQKYTTGVAGQNVSVTWYVTDSKCKLKMQYSDKDVNTTTYYIPDLANGKLLTYNDSPVPAGTAKAYFSVPVQSIRSKNSILLSVEKTNETKDISGFKCEKIIAKTGSSITEIWVTKDFTADCSKFANYFKNSYELAALSQAKILGFPVASTTKDASGNTINAYEISSISTSDISDSEFTVPADYKSADEIGKSK